MGKQATEMLKGTLEGIVLAILLGQPAYGYEITAWLRDQGFVDIPHRTPRTTPQVQPPRARLWSMLVGRQVTVQ